MSDSDQPVPADYGFFGPDSVAWKVFGCPTTFTLAFQRTTVSEMFEPFLLASVNDTQGVLTRPALRFDRTTQYMAMTIFGDSESVLKAADVLVRIHTRIVGTEPISGLPYDANDPEAQLWIHLTAWHSALYCYEVRSRAADPRRGTAVLGRVRAQPSSRPSTSRRFPALAPRCVPTTNACAPC